MNADLPRLLILGAHPDDAEYHAGGLATRFRRSGGAVRMISVTDGSAGHHGRTRPELREIRRREAEAAAAVIGATSEVWDFVDGRLTPTLELRDRIIRAIREFRPNLVLTHRTNDYHPDHRAVGQAVQDASYMVRVPLVAPETPVLARDPVVGFLPDGFTKPNPLSPDVVLDIGEQFETIVAMLACHASQMFEWLPWLEGTLPTVPDAPERRLEWLGTWYAEKIGSRADRCRDALIAAYGAERGRQIRFAEVFEISEYGSPLDASARARLLPIASGASS